MADNSTILEKLDGLVARFEEISTLITDPAVIADQKRYVKLTKEYKDLDDLMKARKEYIQLLGIQKMGVCEFFCLLFVLYEVVSILKNMTLCGLPVPERVREYIQKFLDDMTDELPKEEE